MKEFVKNDKCFDSFNVFPYSDVKGAQAYQLDGKLSNARKLLRFNELMEVMGERNRNGTFVKLNDSQACRYQAIIELENESKTGFFFCKDTYVDLQYSSI